MIIRVHIVFNQSSFRALLAARAVLAIVRAGSMPSPSITHSALSLLPPPGLQAWLSQHDGRSEARILFLPHHHIAFMQAGHDTVWNHGGGHHTWHTGVR